MVYDGHAHNTHTCMYSTLYRQNIEMGCIFNLGTFSQPTVMVFIIPLTEFIHVFEGTFLLGYMSVDKPFLLGFVYKNTVLLCVLCIV